MRAADLDLQDLLDLDTEAGQLRFAGQRALLLDAVALGLLRRELIEAVGMTAARGVLTRFGFAHGWRTAETLRGLAWDNEGEWRRAGGRLHALQGLVQVENVPPSASAGPAAFAEAVWRDSYEAEQHLLHFGRADEAVCWSLAGFASGYMSCCNGREIFCLEVRCRGRGDATCHVVGRERGEWGADIEADLRYYQRDCLDATLAKLGGELRSVERRLRSKRKQLAAVGGELESGLLVRSEAMRRVLERARRVAQVDATVLITGESGVGKERVARLIHESSGRAAGPFVALNCGALPEGLLESELFGHARGAFTGAARERAGLFEAAQGGTLFLDEIGEISAPMQVKLLRVLQEREVRRLGESASRRVDVRVIAATNRDLVEEIHAARFRQDLYYRLRVVELEVPPLRERRDDILPLARAFLVEAAQRARRKPMSLSPQAASLLVRHRWPGNVRELENAIERAVAVAAGHQVERGDLPEELVAPPGGGAGVARSLAEAERAHILAVLEEVGGNRARAAERLQIGAATLYRKLKQYGVTAAR